MQKSIQKQESQQTSVITDFNKRIESFIEDVVNNNLESAKNTFPYILMDLKELNIKQYINSCNCFFSALHKLVDKILSTVNKTSNINLANAQYFYDQLIYHADVLFKDTSLELICHLQVTFYTQAGLTYLKYGYAEPALSWLITGLYLIENYEDQITEQIDTTIDKKVVTPYYLNNCLPSDLVLSQLKLRYGIQTCLLLTQLRLEYGMVESWDSLPDMSQFLKSLVFDDADQGYNFLTNKLNFLRLYFMQESELTSIYNVLFEKIRAVVGTDKRLNEALKKENRRYIDLKNCNQWTMELLQEHINVSSLWYQLRTELRQTYLKLKHSVNTPNSKTSYIAYQHLMQRTIKKLGDEVCTQLNFKNCSLTIVGFGSWSRQDFSPLSDLDIAIFKPLTLTSYNPQNFIIQFNLLLKSLLFCYIEKRRNSEQIELVIMGPHLDASYVSHLFIEDNSKLALKLIQDPQNFARATVAIFEECIRECDNNPLLMRNYIDRWGYAFSLLRPALLYSTLEEEEAYNVLQDYQIQLLKILRQSDIASNIAYYLWVSHCKDYEEKTTYLNAVNLKETFLMPLVNACLDLSLHSELRSDTAILTTDFSKVLKQLKHTSCEPCWVDLIAWAWDYLQTLRNQKQVESHSVKDAVAWPEGIKQQGVLYPLLLGQSLAQLNSEQYAHLQLIEQWLLKPLYQYGELFFKNSKENSSENRVDLLALYLQTLQEDDEKKLLDLANLLIKSNAPAESYAHYYRALNPAIRHIFYPLLRTCLQQQQHPLAQAILLDLAWIPNPDGMRFVVLEQQQQWDKTLRNMAHVAQNEIEDFPIVKMTWLDNKGQYIERYLKPNIAKQMFDSKGNLLPRDDQEDGRGWVKKLYDENKQLFAYSKRSELPAAQLTAERLALRISGLATISTLIRFDLIFSAKNKRYTKMYPLLLSAPAGATLRKARRINGNLQAVELQLHPYFYTLKFYETLLLRPGDDKDDNLAVTEVISSEINTSQTLALKGFDYEQSFIDPPVNKTILQKTVEVKSLILASTHMISAQDKRASTQMQEIDPDQVLSSWLNELVVLHKGWNRTNNNQMKGLFNQDEIQQLGDWQANTDFCFIPIALIPGTVARLYEDWRRLQAVLQEQKQEEDKSHVTLLWRLHPQLAEVYQLNWRIPDLGWQERFDQMPMIFKIVRETLPVNSENNSNLHSSIPESEVLPIPTASKLSATEITVRQSIHKSKEQVKKTLTLIDRKVYQNLKQALQNNYLFSLNAILNEFNLIKKHYHDIHVLSTEIQKENKVVPLTLINDQHWIKEEVLRNIKWQEFYANDPKRNYLIEQFLKGLKGIAFRQLILKDCTLLTDDLLIPLLENSPYLRILDLSGCKNITEKSLKQLPFICPHMERLYLGQQTIVRLEQDRLFRSAISLSLLQLRLLSIEKCPSLTTLQIKAPKLEKFVLYDCEALEEFSFNFDSVALRELELKNCNLTQIGNQVASLILPTVKVLKIIDCYKLEQLNIQSPNLEVLILNNLPKLHYAKTTSEILRQISLVSLSLGKPELKLLGSSLFHLEQFYIEKMPHIQDAKSYMAFPLLVNLEQQGNDLALYCLAISMASNFKLIDSQPISVSSKQVVLDLVLKFITAFEKLDRMLVKSSNSTVAATACEVLCQMALQMDKTIISNWSQLIYRSLIRLIAEQMYYSSNKSWLKVAGTMSLEAWISIFNICLLNNQLRSNDAERAIDIACQLLAAIDLSLTHRTWNDDTVEKYLAAIIDAILQVPTDNANFSYSVAEKIGRVLQLLLPNFMTSSNRTAIVFIQLKRLLEISKNPYVKQKAIELLGLVILKAESVQEQEKIFQYVEKLFTDGDIDIDIKNAALKALTQSRMKFDYILSVLLETSKNPNKEIATVAIGLLSNATQYLQVTEAQLNKIQLILLEVLSLNIKQESVASAVCRSLKMMEIHTWTSVYIERLSLLLIELHHANNHYDYIQTDISELVVLIILNTETLPLSRFEEFCQILIELCRSFNKNSAETVARELRKLATQVSTEVQVQCLISLIIKDLDNNKSSFISEIDQKITLIEILGNMATYIKSVEQLDKFIKRAIHFTSGHRVLGKISASPAITESHLSNLIRILSENISGFSSNMTYDISSKMMALGDIAMHDISTNQMETIVTSLLTACGYDHWGTNVAAKKALDRIINKINESTFRSTILNLLHKAKGHEMWEGKFYYLVRHDKSPPTLALPKIHAYVDELIDRLGHRYKPINMPTFINAANIGLHKIPHFNPDKLLIAPVSLLTIEQLSAMINILYEVFSTDNDSMKTKLSNNLKKIILQLKNENRFMLPVLLSTNKHEGYIVGSTQNEKLESFIPQETMEPILIEVVPLLFEAINRGEYSLKLKSSKVLEALIQYHLPSNLIDVMVKIFTSILKYRGQSLKNNEVQESFFNLLNLIVQESQYEKHNEVILTAILEYCEINSKDPCLKSYDVLIALIKRQSMVSPQLKQVLKVIMPLVYSEDKISVAIKFIEVLQYYIAHLRSSEQLTLIYEFILPIIRDIEKENQSISIKNNKLISPIYQTLGCIAASPYLVDDQLEKIIKITLNIYHKGLSSYHECLFNVLGDILTCDYIPTEKLLSVLSAYFKLFSTQKTFKYTLPIAVQGISPDLEVTSAIKIIFEITMDMFKKNDIKLFIIASKIQNHLRFSLNLEQIIEIISKLMEIMQSHNNSTINNVAANFYMQLIERTLSSFKQILVASAPENSPFLEKISPKKLVKKIVEIRKVDKIEKLSSDLTTDNNAKSQSGPINYSSILSSLEITAQSKSNANNLNMNAQQNIAANIKAAEIDQLEEISQVDSKIQKDPNTLGKQPIEQDFQKFQVDFLKSYKKSEVKEKMRLDTLTDDIIENSDEENEKYSSEATEHCELPVSACKP